MTPRRSISLVTAPSTEPVTLSELKELARIDADDEDALLDDFIAAARQAAEQYTRRALITQAWKLTLDLPACPGDPWWDGVQEGAIGSLYGGLPRTISLPRPPIIGITSVTTYDTSNTPSTFASSNYTVDAAGSRLVLAETALWPTNLRPVATVEILTFNGYGSASDIPMPIRLAIRQHAALLYEARGLCGCELPTQCQQLLRQHRVLDA